MSHDVLNPLLSLSYKWRRGRRTNSCLQFRTIMIPALTTQIIWLALISVGCFAQTVSVSVPSAAPTTAPSVSGSLVSFSIEQDRWVDWIGAGTRNQFWFNLLNNLKTISGEATRIRIGADSEDHTNFNPAVQVRHMKPLFSFNLTY